MRPPLVVQALFMTWAAAACGLAGCSPLNTSQVPCVYPNAPSGISQGEGKGRTSTLAKASARGDLCLTLGGWVSASVKQTQVERAGADESSFFEAVYETVTEQGEDCFLSTEFVSYDTWPSPSGQTCAWARMTQDKYLAWLRSRTTAVEVTTSVNDEAPQRIASDKPLHMKIVAALKRSGYVPMDEAARGDEAALHARVALHVKAWRVPEARSLWVAEGQATLQITDRSTGKIERSTTSDTITVRSLLGQDDLLDAFAVQAAKELAKSLGQPVDPT
jgi:hypothetical protein